MQYGTDIDTLLIQVVCFAHALRQTQAKCMERTLSVVKAESIAVCRCIATPCLCKQAEGFQTDVRVGVATPSIVAYVADGASRVSESPDRD